MLLIFRSKEIIKNKRFLLNKEELSHTKALRLQEGDKIYVGDGEGTRWIAQLEKDEINTWYLHIDLESNLFQQEPHRILCVALPDTKRFDWMLEKSVELGVSYIQPVNWERSERKNYNIERSKRILLQAAGQSQRFFLPQIAPSPIKQ